MEREIEHLLRRARAVLLRHEGTPKDGRSRANIEAAELLAISRPVFYELGVSSTEDGPIGRATLRLEGPGASPRTFRLGVFGSKGKLVLATRWHPVEKRPLLKKGEPRAAGWSEEALEDGEGHLDPSGDLLGLSEGEP